MTRLQQGETIDLGTRVDGGMTVTRDELTDDTFQIDDHGGELSRAEIGRLAELAGFEVVDDE